MYDLHCMILYLLDIDECMQPGACDQFASCENTVGSYTCTCYTGFTGDGRVCTGELQLIAI